MTTPEELKALVEEQRKIYKRVDKFYDDLDGFNNLTRTETFMSNELAKINTAYERFKANHEKLVAALEATDEYHDVAKEIELAFDEVKVKLRWGIRNPMKRFPGYLNRTEREKINKVSAEKEEQERRNKLLDDEITKLRSNLNEATIKLNEYKETLQNQPGGSSAPTDGVAMDKLVTLMNRQQFDKLPEFSGIRKEWAFFKGVYQDTSMKGKFSPWENVNRLRNALKGDAKNLVWDKLMYSSNAEAIMSELEQEFGKPAALVTELMNELFESKRIEKVNDKNLVSFSIKVKDYVATCKSLNREVDLQNEHGLTMLSLKLGSTNYFQPWQRKKNVNQDLNLEDFANFLQEKVREMPVVISSPKDDTRPQNPKQFKGRHNTHQSSDNNDGKRTFSCYKCKQEHPIFKCPEFKALKVPERWNFVREKKLCVGCLRHTHSISACPTMRKCNIDGCTKAHNRFLHSNTEKGTVAVNLEATIEEVKFFGNNEN